MIRLVLADDHALVRQGLRSLLDLTPDLRVVGEAADGEEALLKVAELNPDVVLMDVRMPRMTGLEALHALRRTDPGRRVVLLTTFDEDAAIIEALRSGVQGFLLKDVSLDELADAIRRVASGETLLPPGAWPVAWPSSLATSPTPTSPRDSPAARSRCSASSPGA